MARKLGDRENYRVVVYPKQALWLTTSGKADDLITCEHIAEAVKRHVDDVASAEVEFDQEYHCEHCGSTWTEDDTAYNGGCCDADQTAWEASEPSNA